MIFRRRCIILSINSFSFVSSFIPNVLRLRDVHEITSGSVKNWELALFCNSADLVRYRI